MVIDSERVLLRLKEYIVSKRSHGTSDLLRRIAELEVENEIPEGEEGFDARPPRARQGASSPPADGAPADSRRTVMASH